MELDLSTLTPSDYAAWWGAIIASLALVWNIVVAVRSGARIKVSVSPNMRIYPSQPPTYDNEYVAVKAVNVGNGPTTITHCLGYYTKNKWGIVLKQHRQPFVINTNRATGNDVPHVLNPGEEWANLADQNFLKERAKGSWLYLGVIHNQKRRPIYKRVRLDSVGEPDDT
jgi:hypothetical protein